MAKTNPVNKRFRPVCLNAFLFINLSTVGWMSSPKILAAYKPPPNQKIPPNEVKSDAATVRGCGDQSVALTILAPKLYVGRTSSTHPSFVWHLSASIPAPVQFTLYRLGLDGSLQTISTHSLSSQAGLMRITPFQNGESGLKVGQQYVWNISLICDRNQSSGDLFDRASFEVVPLASSVQKRIADAMSHEQKTEIYAETGLWYDALEEALKLSPSIKLGESGTPLVIDLANSEQVWVDLASFPPKRQAIERRIQTLRMIATQEK